MSKYSEATFETGIEQYLTEQGGFTKRSNTNFDREDCLDKGAFVSFVMKTQPDEWKYLSSIHKGNTEKVLIEDLLHSLYSEYEGCLSVLRHGFKCFGKTFRAAYFAPASGMNPDTKRLYDESILYIIRQVHYSKDHNKSIDVVLTLNGIPIVTIELKNPMTGQTWKNAVHQYKNDRDPNDLLFSFKKRALVHFAVDTDQAYMTTKLDGQNTSFRPFNKGKDNGAGNPDNPEGYRTAYLWEEVLFRDSLMDIIARFLHLQVSERKVGDVLVKKESMIFPRYHQLTCVRSLISASQKEGAGNNYLIQHSAGSGKSNSIAWLAHRLSSLHNEKDEKVFSSVVVITDRVVLDLQLQNTVFQFEHKAGVVSKLFEDSTQLAEALNSQTPIIITTLQKFPFIFDKVHDLKTRKFAVIVDEAHSSMGGETAADMKKALGAKGFEEYGYEPGSLPDQEEEILIEMNKRGKQPNLSFFAFTATPKYKTLEVFGRPGVDGKPEPFHLYSMRQAIEERFILDVLEHYTTYKTYFKLIKAAKDDPKLDKRKAASGLARFLSLHPENIHQKTEVMIEHFLSSTKHKMGGYAKAMVVTRSRLHAVRYKIAFDEYIKEHKYNGLKTLVAFSGAVDDNGVSFTESGMNDGLGQKELPERFNRPEYFVLIVAEKYQTGFDQPLLHTMYVDKRLSGIQAIQTLSRLNRICPERGKEDTFVLDFVNKPEDIQEAFQPYYEKTVVGEQVDYQKLYELQGKLFSYQIYFLQEIREFAKVFFVNRSKSTVKDHAQMNKILDPAVGRFIAKSDDEKEEFRSALNTFRNLYAFLAQIIPFQDSDLEKLYTFLRFLQRKLPLRNESSIYGIEDDVALKYYRLQKISEGSIKLEKSKTGSIDGPTEVGTAAEGKVELQLSKIIDLLNERFKTDFTLADELFLESVKEATVRDSKVREAALVNPIDAFSFVLDKRMNDVIVDRVDQNEAMAARFLNDPAFKKIIMDVITKQVWEKIRKEEGVLA